MVPPDNSQRLPVPQTFHFISALKFQGLPKNALHGFLIPAEPHVDGGQAGLRQHFGHVGLPDNDPGCRLAGPVLAHGEDFGYAAPLAAPGSGPSSGRLTSCQVDGLHPDAEEADPLHLAARMCDLQGSAVRHADHPALPGFGRRRLKRG